MLTPSEISFVASVFVCVASSWSFRYLSTSGWPSTPPAALILAISIFAAASAGRVERRHVLRQVDRGADHDRRAGCLLLGSRTRGADDAEHGQRPRGDCNRDDSCESHAPSLLVEVMGTSCRVSSPDPGRGRRQEQFESGSRAGRPAVCAHRLAGLAPARNERSSHSRDSRDGKGTVSGPRREITLRRSYGSRPQIG